MATPRKNVTRERFLDVGTLALNKVEVTATAADLNLLSGASVAATAIKKVDKVALAALDTGGGVLSWVNPEASAILINRVTIVTSVKSTGASTVDAGTTAASATTSSDNLLDGLDTGTAVVTTDNLQTPGTNGKQLQSLAVGKWVTISRSTGACAGLVGYCYIEYFVL